MTGTTPEMNAKIVSFCKVYGNPITMYAANRIEELEEQIHACQIESRRLSDARREAEAELTAEKDEVDLLQAECKRLTAERDTLLHLVRIGVKDGWSEQELTAAEGLTGEKRPTNEDGSPAE